MRKTVSFFKAMRPKHWIKNSLIILPGLFGGKISSLYAFIWLVWGGIMFSLVTSGIYLINDVHDAEMDALHPTKKRRPIASGELKKTEATIGAVVLMIVGTGGLLLFSKGSRISISAIIAIYILTNVLYSILGWKSTPVLDIVCVASGFIIRVFLGGLLSDAYISTWLFVTILSMSFFMSSEKRRKELEGGEEYRGVLKKYTMRYLSNSGLICLAAGIIFFILWSIEVSNARNSTYFSYIASGIGITGALLYLYDTETRETSDPVEIILGDKKLIILALCFIAAFTSGI